VSKINQKRTCILGIIIALFCMLGISAPAQAAKSKAVKSAPPRKVVKVAPPAKTQKTRSASSGRGLAREWEPNNELVPYKQNYLLLYAVSSKPNNTPTSPNSMNQILVPYALDQRDMKFQISLKHDLADFQEYGSVWFGYTQLSFWQFYNTANSQPFRETIYEPEFIYSIRPNEASIFNFGIVHQSNGESRPRSRSWNRIYIQPAIELINDGGELLIVQARWWQRIQENIADDDNPDIAQYLGYREIEIRYIQEGNWEISAIGRSKSVQVDIAAPWTSWFLLDDSEVHNANVHLQYFNGYGESLLDYNQAHTTWGIGISFPY
jgi:phospholipase A1